MTVNGYKQMNSIYMWEMWMIAYIKSKKIHLIKGNINKRQRACGIANMVGNKGGIQMYFNLNDRYYNFIACHLIHGQDNRIKRDEMMEELIRNFKIEREEMDPDIVCDYNFIMGDLNYRFDTTFEEMIESDKIKIANELVD